MTEASETLRTIIKISGSDKEKFLQGLITNDIAGLKKGLVYSALLTPQGKFLADFFLVPWGGDILLDISSKDAAGTLAKLTMYRLRSDVQFAIAEDLCLVRGLGPAPDSAFSDPRSDALGWRLYGPCDALPKEETVDWDALRIANLVPESGQELVANESYILEMGFERLNGVNFKKGCYVGQEVTARMKHKTELRKGLRRISLDGSVEPGTTIESDGKSVGQVFTQSKGRALAYLRFDRIGENMEASGVAVTIDDA